MNRVIFSLAAAGAASVLFASEATLTDGVLDIAPGARLEIDGSACSGGRTLFPLVRATGGIRGAFAPENVVCLGRDIGYRVTANGIDAFVTRGTVLLFR